MLQDAGSSFGPDGVHKSFVCGACGRGFTLGSSDIHAKQGAMTVVRGPAWCFEGSHTIKPISGNRRVFTDLAELTPGSLQEDIDGLDGDKVRVLKIFADGFYDDKEKPTLNRPMPALEELLIENVDMGNITLNASLTPNLKIIKMQNVTEECTFDIILPTLEIFHMNYYGPTDDFGWIVRMLENAPNLVEFDSYKLRVSYLGFYSNSLRSIRLHRAELLARIDLWTPNLVDLNVQAAYDLHQVHFLKDHALKSQLPSDFRCMEELRVNSANAILGEQALAELNAHPRVRETIVNEDYSSW